MKENNVKIESEMLNECDISIPPNKMCKVTEVSTSTEITIVNKLNNNLSKYQKYSKDYYINTDTGEVLRYNNDANNVKNKSWSKLFNSLKLLINNNFQCKSSEKHLVLTYAIPQYDSSCLGKDFKRFWEKLKRRFNDLEYIRIFEPAKKGHWHIHMLVKRNTEEHLVISEKLATEIWGLGNVFVSDIRFENFGNYFVPALTKTKKSSKHLIEKAKRLPFYPQNMKIYHSSKGIVNVTSVLMSYGEAMERVEDKKLTYAKRTHINKVYGDKFQEVNSITYLQYQ